MRVSWSIEYRVGFGDQPQIPRPAKGSRWSVDMQRGFRDHQERSMWTRDLGEIPSGTSGCSCFNDSLTQLLPLNAGATLC